MTESERLACRLPRLMFKVSAARFRRQEAAFARCRVLQSDRGFVATRCFRGFGFERGTPADGVASASNLQHLRRLETQHIARSQQPIGRPPGTQPAHNVLPPHGRPGQRSAKGRSPTPSIRRGPLRSNG